MNAENRARLERMTSSVRHEWSEAPWFVILMIGIAAIVGPGLIWALWRAFTSLF